MKILFAILLSLVCLSSRAALLIGTNTVTGSDAITDISIPGTATIGTGAFTNFSAQHFIVSDITLSNKLVATSPTSTTITNGYAAALTNTWGIFDGDTSKFVNGSGSLSTPAGGSAMVGTVSNNVASAGLLAVDLSKTNGIAATAAHVGAALGTSAVAGVPLISDGTATPIWFDPSQYLIAFDDFLNTTAVAAPYGPLGFGSRSANSGVVSAVAGDATSPGLISLVPSAANSVATLQTSVSAIRLGGGVWDLEWRIKTPAALSSEAGTYYESRVGFIDSDNTTNVVDGVYFRYANTTSGGFGTTHWQLVTRSNSSENYVDSTVTVDTNTWYKLRIVVNADGSAATGYINGDAGTGFNAATIPTGAGRETAIGASCISVQYSSSKTMLVDYVRLYHKITTAR